uniref:ARAD1D17490p n=1 Tax=Blastobotrys adeninivorans TaxID=409370 RepID=A0A060TEW7_BLAAD
MLVQLLVPALALLWLLHRATRLLKIPAPLLINILGIDLPETPKVSVDTLTSTSVSLHWNPPQRLNLVIKYILQVNGRKAGETDRSDSCVTIKDLTPNTEYSISIWAVNPNNYRSLPATVQIHTKKSVDEAPPPTIHLAGVPHRLISDDSSTASSLPASTAANNTNLSTGTKQSTVRLRSSTRNLTNNPSKSSSGQGKKKRPSDTTINCSANSSAANGVDDEKSVYTIQALTAEVENAQAEISEVLAQAAHGEAEFEAAESVLIAELETLKERKKTEDQHRSQIRSEIKSLEDSKRSLEIQKAKVEKRFKQISDQVARKSAHEKQWDKEISESKEKVKNIEVQIERLNMASLEKLEELKSSISDNQARLSSLEDEVKELANKARKAETTKLSTTQAIEEMRGNTDNVTGIIAPAVSKRLLETDTVSDQFRRALESEIAVESELEEEWQRVQKDLEVRYLKVKDQYERAVQEHKDAVKLYNQQQQVQLQQPNGVSQNVVLETLNAAAAASGISPQLSQPQLQTTSSGPGSHSVSPTSSIAPQPVPTSIPATTYDESRILYSPQPALHQNPMQPAVPQHQSSRNFRDLPKIDSFTYLNRSDSLRRRSIADDVHDNGGPLSPSVDILLPSNLFGTDDLTESFANLLNDPALPLDPSRRASGNILGQTFSQAPGNRGSGSSASPKPSLRSLNDRGIDGGGSAVPSSPQSGNFPLFPLFPNSNPTSVPISPLVSGSSEVSPEMHEPRPPTSPKKKGLFYFGRRNGENSNGRHQNTSSADSGHSVGSPLSNIISPPPAPGPVGDSTSLNGFDIGPIGGLRPRGSSFNSTNSRPGSSAFFSNYTNPADNNSLLLAPSHSHNGSVLSLESSRFGEVLNNRGGNPAMEKSSLWKQSTSSSGYGDEYGSSAMDTPMILVNDRDGVNSTGGDDSDSFMPSSLDSRASSANSGVGSKFSKSFAGLFSPGDRAHSEKHGDKHSDKGEKSDKSDKHLPEKTDSAKSIPALFGKVNVDELGEPKDSKESIIQKSMRSLTTRKASSSSTASGGSGKFKVRSLSFFGGKKDREGDRDDTRAIAEENETTDEGSSVITGRSSIEMDMQEFLTRETTNDVKSSPA